MVGGRIRLIDSPDTFEKLAEEYMQWVKDNPVMKTITASFQGEISYLKVPHARPMTQYGLASYMGVGLSTLKDYGNREEFSATYKRINSTMTAWNIDGATSGDFNSGIISRIEGLTDKQEVALDAKIESKSMEDIFK